MKTEKPTRDRVMELLDYEPDTGLFRWRIDRHAMPWTKVALAGDVAGCVTKKNGWVISIDGKQYKAHHLAWLIVKGVWPDLINHRDGCRTNNVFTNLREATQQVNTQNMRRAMSSNKSSGLLGVSTSRSSINPWKAQIRINGAISHLGSFPTKETAHAAYVKAKRTHHEGCTI